ncbi:MAG: arginyltransferase [Myxococcales bacterium]|nr:arginyltransferase [Myxococcales bacterium]MCB9750532.1 arginyltransferase [Myxococcales bacterium]
MRWRPRLLAAEPPELLVHDEPTPCPYLDQQVARMPLRVPTRMLTGGEFDSRLTIGDRRQGVLLYRTSCPDCRACEPIRLDVERFRPGKTQRRVFRRAVGEVTVQLGPPQLSDEKVELYNRHKFGRGLNSDDKPIDHEGYRVFLVDSCCDSFEIRYRVGERLIGVAVTDRGADSLSAVYFYFDPAFEHLSPGVFSILTQVELCRRWGLRYLYLGLYIGGCASMAYKARYTPHERLVNGVWREFARTGE